AGATSRGQDLSGNQCSGRSQAADRACGFVQVLTAGCAGSICESSATCLYGCLAAHGQDVPQGQSAGRRGAVLRAQGGGGAILEYCLSVIRRAAADAVDFCQDGSVLGLERGALRIGNGASG